MTMKINRVFLFLIIPLLFPLRASASTDPLVPVAKELAGTLVEHGDFKIAVLALPHHDNHLSDGPFVVSERLATLLGKDKRLFVVERSQIDQVLQELHLSETGVLDPSTVQALGQALGADIIVTGTLIDLADEKTEVNARAVRTDNGRIIAASRTLVDRNWPSRRRLEW